MSKKLFYSVMAFIIYAITIGLILHWYDWRLLIILMLFGWAMRLEDKK